MIIAIGLNRIPLGLGLIVSFSFGLAAVLIVIGILLVRARALVERVGGLGGRLGGGLPLASAVIFAALGVGMVLKGLAGSRGQLDPGRYVATSRGVALVAAFAGMGLVLLVRTTHGWSPWPIGGNTPALAVAAPHLASALLPPRYRDGRAVSAAPMGAAPLVYDDEGRVACDRIWGHDDPEHPFSDLALAGGPPHRGTRLEPASADAVAADPAGYAHARAELTADAAPGWIGLACDDAVMASWLALAINAENVAARQEGATLYLPAGPSFRLDQEIKNVVTAAA